MSDLVKLAQTDRAKAIGELKSHFEYLAQAPWVHGKGGLSDEMRSALAAVGILEAKELMPMFREWVKSKDYPYDSYALGVLAHLDAADLEQIANRLANEVTGFEVSSYSDQLLTNATSWIQIPAQVQAQNILAYRFSKTRYHHLFRNFEPSQLKKKSFLEFPKDGSRSLVVGGCCYQKAIVGVVKQDHLQLWNSAYDLDWKRHAFEYNPIDRLYSSAEARKEPGAH